MKPFSPQNNPFPKNPFEKSPLKRPIVVDIRKGLKKGVSFRERKPDSSIIEYSQLKSSTNKYFHLGFIVLLYIISLYFSPKTILFFESSKVLRFVADTFFGNGFLYYIVINPILSSSFYYIFYMVIKGKQMNDLFSMVFSLVVSIDISSSKISPSSYLSLIPLILIIQHSYLVLKNPVCSKQWIINVFIGFAYTLLSIVFRFEYGFIFTVPLITIFGSFMIHKSSIIQKTLGFVMVLLLVVSSLIILDFIERKSYAIQYTFNIASFSEFLFSYLSIDSYFISLSFSIIAIMLIYFCRFQATDLSFILSIALSIIASIRFPLSNYNDAIQCRVVSSKLLVLIMSGFILSHINNKIMAISSLSLPLLISVFLFLIKS